MSKYAFTLATIRYWDRGAGYLVESGDGRVFVNPLLMSGYGYVPQRGDTVVMVIRDSQAFILGRRV